MLLPRIPRVTLLRRLRNCRNFADATPTYSSKVRALPFSISQEDAVKTMNNLATYTFTTKDVRSAWKGLVSHIFGTGTIQPKHVQAVYLPAWIVDAEVEANAWLGDSSQELMTVQLVDSYLPGYAYDFLSRICLNDDIDPDSTLPFSQDLTTQHGSEVLCLPYNISPFSVADKLESSPKRITIDEDLRFDSAVTYNFLAAYPILIPLYLGQYEADGRSTTVVIEAGSPLSGGYFEVFDDYWPEFRHSFIAKAFAHVHGEYYRTRSGARPFAHVCGPPRKQSIQLREWLDGVITRPGAAEQSVSKSPVDFSDARVRVYTEEDTDQNRTFLQLGTQIAGLNHLLKTFAENSDFSDQSVVIEIGTKGVSKIGGDAFSSAMKSEIANLKEKRLGVMPQWWKDWEAVAKGSS